MCWADLTTLEKCRNGVLSARTVVQALSKYVQTIRLSVASREVYVAVKVAAALRGTSVRPMFWEMLYVVLEGVIVSVLSRLYVFALILTPSPRFKVLDADYSFPNDRDRGPHVQIGRLFHAQTSRSVVHPTISAPLQMG